MCGIHGEVPDLLPCLARSALVLALGRRAPKPGPPVSCSAAAERRASRRRARFPPLGHSSPSTAAISVFTASAAASWRCFRVSFD